MFGFMDQLEEKMNQEDFIDSILFVMGISSLLLLMMFIISSS